MKHQRRPRAARFGLLVLLTLVGACTRQLRQPPLAIVPKQDPGAVQRAFNEAKGETRLLVLLSPT